MVDQRGGYSYTLCIKDGENEITDIILPNKVVINNKTYKITKVGTDSFSNMVYLPWLGEYRDDDSAEWTSIKIPSTVTEIGDYAFSNCEKLTSIEIPTSVTSIGIYAFSGCSRLTNVYYTGIEEDWAKITIGSGNSRLTSATIHYNYTPES